MFTYLTRTPRRELFRQGVPALVIAFVIAELFYKFHSFMLECAAFLVTWFALDFVFDQLRRLLGGRAGEQSPRA